jgi:hypothetical protein
MKKPVPHVAASPDVLIFADDLVQPLRVSAIRRVWMNEYGKAR